MTSSAGKDRIYIFDITVCIEEGNKTVVGRGADTDTLMTSCRACINALNKLIVRRGKSIPAAMIA